jgi:hypothetical protein
LATSLSYSLHKNGKWRVAPFIFPLLHVTPLETNNKTDRGGFIASGRGAGWQPPIIYQLFIAFAACLHKI